MSALVGVGMGPGDPELVTTRAVRVLREVERVFAPATAIDAVGRAVDEPDAAVVVYKGGRHLPAIAKRLADAGRLDGSVAGELLGLPGERVAPVGDMAADPASYLMTVIVPPTGRRRTGG